MNNKVIEITNEQFKRLPDQFKWNICYEKTNIKVVHKKEYSSSSRISEGRIKRIQPMTKKEIIEEIEAYIQDTDKAFSDDEEFNRGWKSAMITCLKSVKDLQSADENLTEEEIELLKRALDIYAFYIDQHQDEKFDVNDSNRFFLMREKLSSIIGIDVT